MKITGQTLPQTRQHRAPFLYESQMLFGHFCSKDTLKEWAVKGTKVHIPVRQKERRKVQMKFQMEKIKFDEVHVVLHFFFKEWSKVTDIAKGSRELENAERVEEIYSWSCGAYDRESEIKKKILSKVLPSWIVFILLIKSFSSFKVSN